MEAFHQDERCTRVCQAITERYVLVGALGSTIVMGYVWPVLTGMMMMSSRAKSR